jgi:hypothetical protein
MGKQTDAQLEEAAQSSALDHHLVVVHPFGDYRRGDAIKDPAEIAAVLAGENAHHCRKVITQ